MRDRWHRTVSWSVLALCGTVMYTGGMAVSESPSSGSISEACQRIGAGFLACSTLALIVEMIVAAVRGNSPDVDRRPEGFEVVTRNGAERKGGE